MSRAGASGIHGTLLTILKLLTAKPLIIKPLINLPSSSKVGFCTEQHFSVFNPVRSQLLPVF